MIKVKENGRTSVILLFVLAVSCGVALRVIVSVHSYSGQNQPPMYGDYEAQRHWMEITVNLPARDWYRSTSDNDLQYWGLDYPPLAAYHSLFTGTIATFFNESYVSLYRSRGYESAEHKVFMRCSVLLSDMVTFLPALVYYYETVRQERRVSPYVLKDILLIVLIYPGYIIIDHGHFQYNCLPLGLTVLAIIFLFKDRLLLSSVFFCSALNCKQISLYHALTFFVFILRRCFREKTIFSSFVLLLKVSSTVILTFLLIWSPFLSNADSILHVIHRLFPVARGVFEDKVANAWCAINVFYKLNEHFSKEDMLRICSGLTLAFSIPSLLRLMFVPSRKQFLLSLINVSFAFFLFSFQVHEKSILLVALPVLLFIPYDITACTWFLSITNVSLFHLVIKDNLALAYTALLVIFQTFIINNDNLFSNEKRSLLWKLGVSSSYVGSFCIYALFLFAKPPVRYPDLWPLLTAVFSFVHFSLFFVYFNYVQLFGSERFIRRSISGAYSYQSYNHKVQKKSQEKRKTKRKNSQREGKTPNKKYVNL